MLASHLLSIAISVILFSLPAAMAQSTWYIDFDAGTDSNDGTSPDTPFKHSPGDPAATASAAAVSLQPGDTVRFKGGLHYRGTIDITASGADGAPILFDGNTDGAYGTGRAIIDGSEPLTGWQRVTTPDQVRGNPHWQNLWYANVPADTDVFTANLTQGEQLMALARTPQLSDPFFMDERSTMRNVVEPAVTAEGAADTTYIDAEFFNQPDPDYWRGSFFAIWAQPNRVYNRRVTGYDPATHRIRFERLSATQYAGTRGQFAMINVLGALQRPGDYYVDPVPDADGNKRVYAWPFDVGPDGPQAISISRRATGFHLHNPAHLTIQGFLIQKQGANTARGIFSPNGARHVTLRDNEIRFLLSHSRDAAIGMTGGEHVLIQDNYIHHNRNSRGMRLQNMSNVVADRNHLDYNGSTGLTFFTCSNSRMTRNLVTNHKGVHANGLTVYVNSEDVLVEGNIARDGGHAFTVQDGVNITVRNNILQSSSGAIGIWSGTHKNLRIEHNILLGVNQDATLVTTPTGMKYDGLFIRNNIIAGTYGDLPAEFSHNIYTRKGRNETRDGIPDNSLLIEDLNQLFMNPAEGDYRHRPGSPAIDAALDLGVPHDFAGHPRPQGPAPDIGAYEHPRD